MKIFFGSDINTLSDFLKDSRLKRNDPVRLAAKQSIHVLSLGKALKFIKLSQSDQIFDIDYIQRHFEFKLSFINKCVLKSSSLTAITFAPPVKLMLRDILKNVISACDTFEHERIVFFSPKEFKEQFSVSISKDEALKLLPLIRKRVLIFRHDFARYVYNNYDIYFEGQLHNISQQGVFELIGKKWSSLKTLKSVFEVDHDVQMYRILSDPSYSFVKVVHKGYLSSGKKTQVRYIKMINI